MPRRLRTPCLVALLVLCGACRSIRSGVLAVTDPVADMVAPAATADETCGDEPPRVPPPDGATVVRIGAWNMHYLGPSPETPRETRDPRAVAAYVRASKVSALALEEIGVVATPQGPRPLLLEAVLDELSSGGSRWAYRLFVYPWNPSECTGLAWDTTVFTEVEPPVKIAMPVRPPRVLHLVHLPFQSRLWDKVPFAVKLSAGRGRSDFVFVPTHLRARVELEAWEDATEYREHQAEQLAAMLPKLRAHFHDDDVVVLGDMNTEARTEDVIDSFVERGWRDLNCADHATHRMGAALDRIFVPSHQPEFAAAPNFGVFAPEGMSWAEFAERLSDHRLVAADVLVTADDD